MEALRAYCVNLARLRRNKADEGVGDEPYFKVEKAIPTADLEPLRETFGPVERAHLLGSVMTVLEFYCERDRVGGGAWGEVSRTVRRGDGEEVGEIEGVGEVWAGR